MKLKLPKGPTKEAFIVGMLTEAGMCVAREMYLFYKDIDPLKGARNKIKVKQRKKEFDKIMEQIDLKKDLA